MKPNPILKKLGLNNNDRAVIIHTDDIGMCQASVAAFADLVDFGLISSGATMVPCPWFLDAAEYCRIHPQADMGVHLTLTSEWKNYRWGPISTRDPQSGMLDDQGFFYPTSAQAQEHADPAAALVEIQAQIARATQAGINPTHADTHMGTLAHPKFVGAYIQSAIQARLPIMMFRFDEAGWARLNLDPETVQIAMQMVDVLEEQGVPLLDNMDTVHLENPDNRLERAQKAISDLPPGITHFIIHPSKDTPELRAITPDWRSRVGDYETFTSEAMRKFLQNCGVRVIGYRDLQHLMPK